MLPVLREVIKEHTTSLEAVIIFERDKEIKQPLLGRATGKYTLPFLKYSYVFCDEPLVKPEIDPPSDLVAIMYTSIHREQQV